MNALEHDIRSDPFTPTLPYMLLSPAIQDYLKVIFTIQEEHSLVTTNDIARALKVSETSVTGLIKRLDQMQLVVHES